MPFPSNTSFRDGNHVPVASGQSNGDSTQVLPFKIDSITGRVLVDSSGSSSFSVMVPTGTVNGSNNVFTFASAPQIVVLDNGNIMNKTSSDGTANWTGTTTITLNQAPNFNVFGF